MKILIRGRLLGLMATVLGVGMAAFATFDRDISQYFAGVTVAFGGLSALLASESFGPIAQRRHPVTRWVSRVLLVVAAAIAVVAFVAWMRRI